MFFNSKYTTVFGPYLAQIGHLEKRLSNGWRKRQVTLVVSHKARP